MVKIGCEMPLRAAMCKAMKRMKINRVKKAVAYAWMSYEMATVCDGW